MNNEIFADELIKQFSGIWPSLRATMRPEDILQYQGQMIKALTETGLNTPEAIQQGFRKARTEGGQYLPSVPEFVRWCKVPVNRPEHKLLEFENKPESTREEKDAAHKLIKEIRDSL